MDIDSLPAIERTSDGAFEKGRSGVVSIRTTLDKKVEFVRFDSGKFFALVSSAMGYPAYYPVHAIRPEAPIEALLMDLDGTSVHSEQFWIWIIELTTASLLGNPRFELEEADVPHVSGHSVSEHLQYCVSKYCPGNTVEEARRQYFEHVHREMREILEGRGRTDAFSPAPGLKEFLLEVKGRGVRIGLVTSGLYEKAMPEIISAFRQLGMGNPVEFYDAIITAGFPMRKGREVGTLGELSPKPHPWLYSETCRVGLGIPFEQRSHVLGMEDSGAGVCSLRLAGFAAIGVSGGNIEASGTRPLCHGWCGQLSEALQFIK